jgi:hypothetical protein
MVNDLLDLLILLGYEILISFNYILCYLLVLIPVSLRLESDILIQLLKLLSLLGIIFIFLLVEHFIPRLFLWSLRFVLIREP